MRGTARIEAADMEQGPVSEAAYRGSGPGEDSASAPCTPDGPWENDRYGTTRRRPPLAVERRGNEIGTGDGSLVCQPSPRVASGKERERKTARTQEQGTRSLVSSCVRFRFLLLVSPLRQIPMFFFLKKMKPPHTAAATDQLDDAHRPD